MSHDARAAFRVRVSLRRSLADTLVQLPALILAASAVVRILLPAPFAVRCTSVLLLPASTGSDALPRAGALVVAGAEFLLAVGLVVRGTRRLAQHLAAIELVLVSMVAAAFAQPELMWLGLGLAPLAFLVQNRLLVTLVAVAYVLLLSGAFLARGKLDSSAP